MKFIILFGIFICNVVIINAQCFDRYVKTPNNSDVKVCNSGGFPDWWVQEADQTSRYYAIEVFEAGTNSYNCHAYAWYIKEGGNRCWLNNLGYEVNNLNAYWNDYSYLLFDYNNLPHAANLKVFYGSTYSNNDHSAITTTNPDVFISKMGPGCLVSHRKDNSPYDNSNLRYYKRGPTISGPTLTCPPTATYIINDYPSGVQSVSWSAQYGMTLQAPGTNSATFNVGNIYERYSSVSATLTLTNGSSITLPRYNVSVNGPSVREMIIENRFTWQRIDDTYPMLCPNTIYSFWLNTEGCQLSNYIWTVPSGWSLHQGVQSHAMSIQTNNQSGYVTLKATTCCGVSNTIIYSKYFSISSSNCGMDWSPYLAYPNPASNILNVEIDQEAVSKAEALDQTTDAKQIKKETTYDVRLYDGQGNLLRQKKTKGGKLEFNVASLTNGIYYLHIYDGVNEKPDMRQIVVEH